MERGDERDVLGLRHLQGHQAGRKGRMGMDNLETAAVQFRPQERVNLRNSGHIRMPEWNRNGRVIKDFVGILSIIGVQFPGRDDRHPTHFLLDPARVVLHAHRYTIHHRRKTLIEKAYISFHDTSF